MATTGQLSTSVLEPGEEERRRGKPILQGELEEIGVNGCRDEDFTKVVDHLSPEAGEIWACGSALEFLDCRLWYHEYLQI